MVGGLFWATLEADSGLLKKEGLQLVEFVHIGAANLEGVAGCGNVDRN